jgi:hypothetical protein
MNYKQSKFYINQLLQAEPDDLSVLAISLADWFLTNYENNLEGTPEDEYDLRLMSAPMGCAALLNYVAEAVVLLSKAYDGDTYNNEFEWPDELETVGGATQAYNIAHICMTDFCLTREEFVDAAQQISLVLLGVAEAISADDRRVIAMSVVGTVMDEIPVSVQKEISDEVLALFASHGIELESTLVNFQQPTDGIGESNVIIS